MGALVAISSFWNGNASQTLTSTQNMQTKWRQTTYLHFTSIGTRQVPVEQAQSASGLSIKKLQPSRRRATHGALLCHFLTAKIDRNAVVFNGVAHPCA